MEKSKIIRITLKSLNLIKDIFPAKRNESMALYFDRLASQLEYMQNERWRGRYDD